MEPMETTAAQQRMIWISSARSWEAVCLQRLGHFRQVESVHELLVVRDPELAVFAIHKVGQNDQIGFEWLVPDRRTCCMNLHLVFRE